MVNWRVRIETDMEDCPSAEELQRERDELDPEIPDSDSDPQG